MTSLPAGRVLVLNCGSSSVKYRLYDGDLVVDGGLVERIGEAVGATEEQVLEALEAAGAYRATSFDAPRSNDDDAGDSLADAFGDEETGFGLAEDRATLERLMAAITPREREVLRLRFVEDLTQAEIGARIGVSQMQVSRLIRQSLARLRTAALAAERQAMKEHP